METIKQTLQASKDNRSMMRLKDNRPDRSKLFALPKIAENLEIKPMEFGSKQILHQIEFEGKPITKSKC